MAELALLMPVLAMALMSLVDFGMVLYAHIQVSNAAREGARAASLYRQTRYQYLDTSGNSVAPCSGSIDGWSVQQTAEEAIVTHSKIANGGKKGCPDPSGTITATALGWLEPVPTPTTWSVTIDPAYTSNVMPTPGDRATLTLRYPYRLLILSGFVPALQDPVWISKSVDYEYQR
jgi:hypothetical protein